MITENQRKLMQHTISGPGRNWFATGYDSEDSLEFEKLVKLDFAVSQKAPCWTCDDVVYQLTSEGMQQLKD